MLDADRTYMYGTLLFVARSLIGLRPALLQLLLPLLSLTMAVRPSDGLPLVGAADFGLARPDRIDV